LKIEKIKQQPSPVIPMNQSIICKSAAIEMAEKAAETPEWRGFGGVSL